jgi:hypothetical protein
MAAFFCVVLSFVGRGLVMGRSRLYTNVENGFIVSEVNSQSTHARGQTKTPTVTRFIRWLLSSLTPWSVVLIE